MFPPGFSEKFTALLGPEAEAFFAAFDRSRAPGLRRNPLRFDAALPDFGLERVPWCPEGYTYDPACRPGLHPYHEAGLYYLQEPSAMAPAEILGARPGERVLDLCAAPGGKATQLAAAMAGAGLLICNEIVPARARALSRNLERMGVRNALVLNETPDRLAARLPGFFDRILVDAPCSGEGMFRKEADAVTDWSPETVALCAARQGTILDAAAQMLRPGGRLVYSTCTFSPEEDEGVIAAFLAAHPEFALLPIEGFAPGRPEWADGNPELTRCARLWPHLLRGEGHFAALLEKRGGEVGAAALEAGEPLPTMAAEALSELVAEDLRGPCAVFGSTVYRLPEGCPTLRGLKVLRAGLELGELARGRFVPSHALALAAPARQTAEVSAADVGRYLRGETLPGDARGWAAITFGGLALGWVKGSDGVLKNHFPKGLRWVSDPIFPG